MTKEVEAALGRLVVVAKSDTGQSRRVANFLLAWWNGDDWGHFPISDLFGLDTELARDIATIIAFLAAVAPILEAAGPLPHARLNTAAETTAPKKQAARMLKCECATCGYTVRTARKWLETAGAPLCPIEDHGPMHHDMLDDQDAEESD